MQNSDLKPGSTEVVEINPRWGTEGRPEKAEAIRVTLSHYAGCGVEKGTWVDIGCGSGGIAATLAPRVERIYGIDPEPWSQWSTLAEQNENLFFLKGRSVCDELGFESADVVVCNQVYEHVPDPVCLINDIYRALIPGGICYFAGPNLLFPIEPHVHWPFVHWLPRSFAVKLMRTSRAKFLVDANSVTYWKLKQWMKDFTIENAVPWILRNPGAFKREGLIWQVLKKTPVWLIGLLTPLSPGFVFILRKTEKPAAENDKSSDSDREENQ